MGLAESVTVAAGPVHPQLGAPADVYEYVDEAGDVRFVVCRFQPKTFRQAHRSGGGWVWNLDGVERVLYRLPEVNAALAAGDTIWITEGEKDADALAEYGIAATCNPQGAGKFTPELAEQLAGARHVRIVVDRDDEDKRDTAENRILRDLSPKGADNLTPGERHALQVRERLATIAGVATADIELVQAAEGKDAFDHLAAGRSPGNFEAWQPPPPPNPVPQAEAGRAGFNLTDLGNAERLVTVHAEDLRFVPQLGWHSWDGRRWRTDGDGEAQRRAKDTVRATAAEAVRDLEGDDRKKQLQWALRSESRPRLEAMVALAETDRRIIVGVDELDRDRHRLNVRNGTVDLRTATLTEHRREDHNTKLAPVDYQPEAEAPCWGSFLNTIFAGDAALIGFVQRAVGYSMTGDTSEQVLFLLHGRGANGKSTFVETIRAALGDYAQQAPTDLLMQTRSARGGATPDLARLPGARFVATVETGEGKRLDEPLVKQLTGGDRIAARRLYRDVFEFTPTHKLWLATNHLPQIAGTDDAIWRRIRLIPFTVTIPEADRDPSLPHRLRDELAGILAWAIQGCRNWRTQGLNPPDAIAKATRAYRDDMDELGAFLDECADQEHLDATVRASILYTRYGYWAQAAGTQPISATAFGRALTERGFHKTKMRDGWHYVGMALAAGEGGDLN